MRNRWLARWTKGLSWAPNFLVLCVLLGIGWWGHTWHWTLPHMASGHDQLAVAGDPLPVDEPVEKPITKRQDRLALFSRLPGIKFKSPAAAQ